MRGSSPGLRPTGAHAHTPLTVVRLDGVFSVPDVEYHCDGTREEPTYSVRFESLVLWGEPGDPVHVDLWESYLEAADE